MDGWTFLWPTTWISGSTIFPNSAKAKCASTVEPPYSVGLVDYLEPAMRFITIMAMGLSPRFQRKRACPIRWVTMGWAWHGVISTRTAMLTCTWPMTPAPIIFTRITAMEPSRMLVSCRGRRSAKTAPDRGAWEARLGLLATQAEGAFLSPT